MEEIKRGINEILSSDDISKKDKWEIKQCLKDIEKNYIKIIDYIGNYYFIKKNYREMKKYYLIAINEGSVMSMNNMGHYYSKKNHEKSKKYYLMAIKNGCMQAKKNLLISWDNNSSQEIINDIIYTASLMKWNKAELYFLKEMEKKKYIPDMKIICNSIKKYNDCENIQKNLLIVKEDCYIKDIFLIYEIIMGFLTIIKGKFINKYIKLIIIKKILNYQQISQARERYVIYL